MDGLLKSPFDPGRIRAIQQRQEIGLRLGNGRIPFRRQTLDGFILGLKCAFGNVFKGRNDDRHLVF
jgi:hypothetical protein